MSYTHTYSTTLKSGTDTIAGVTDVVTGDSEVGFDGSIAAGGTNVEIDIDFKTTEMQSVGIIASGALTVKTNSTTAVDSLGLLANRFVGWKTGDLLANPFTANVAKLFVTNAGAAAATLKIRVLRDSTP